MNEAMAATIDSIVQTRKRTKELAHLAICPFHQKAAVEQVNVS